MARTLFEDDQDWPAVDRREESPEQVRLPAWGWLAVAFGLAFWLRGPLTGLLDGPALGTWTTVFVSISVQALPFLVLGWCSAARSRPWCRPAGPGAAQAAAGGGAGGRAGRGRPAGL